MNIWQFNKLVMRRLAGWAAVSVAAGLWMQALGTFWRGFGAQAVGWGLVDAAIALFGGQAADNRQAALPNPDSPESTTKEANNLRRILWLNAGLDVLYILGGLVWTRRKRGQAYGEGTGWGVVVQGLFLFLFDLFHALSVPDRKRHRP